jgi:hypothetical protein
MKKRRRTRKEIAREIKRDIEHELKLEHERELFVRVLARGYSVDLLTHCWIVHMEMTGNWLGLFDFLRLIDKGDLDGLLRDQASEQSLS